MPYDHAKTRNLLTISKSYANHPTGDFINELALQLIDAEQEIKALTAKASDSLLEGQESERRLLAESQAHRTTRERFLEANEGLTKQKGTCMAALTSIVGGAESPVKVAQAALDTVNPPPAPVPAAEPKPKRPRKPKVVTPPPATP